jgi:hypothetical protein
VSAGDLALVVATVLCALGFAGLVVALLAVARTLRELRGVLDAVGHQAAQLQAAAAEAGLQLDRVDRVVGSAESISQTVDSASRLAQAAFSTPVIKTVALASGTSRAARRLRGAR